MSEAPWATMDRAEISAAYDNAGSVADSQARLAAWRQRSAATRARDGALLDLAYGDRPRNRIDLFPCGRRDAPLLLFFHGGYWQRNAKEGFACMAEGPLALGLDVALAGYTLCPEVSMSDLVAEARAAVAWLAANARAHGVAMSRLVLAGWSAGAHLALSCADHPAVEAALLVSGVYDLEPIRRGALNDALRMDESEAFRLSPLRHIAPSRVRLVVAWGGRELPELRRQSADFAAAWRAAGNDAAILPLEDEDHFSILETLASPTGALARAAADLAG